MAAPMARNLAGGIYRAFSASCNLQRIQRCLSSLPSPLSCQGSNTFSSAINRNAQGSLLNISLPVFNAVRSKVTFSIRRGKEKSVRSVPSRFFRLPWGIYIHARAGRNKHKWNKPDWIIARGKQHVFCNKSRAKLFDKMTSPYWRKHRHYVDDPYAPYYKRTGPGMQGSYSPPKFLP
ncbi:hypothetical protein DPMN_165740 [Dreissena polymorpha]|uniref:Large ribosomal subunit protein bL35m n=2 Tax=Dreissena polymorpha TaxID=45954 RepID=A0A9D4EVG8_DREPO|nr:hypothetical protein DPMN_165740 [Dreissena polymorpha]